MINKRRRKNWLKVCKFLCLKCFDRLKYKIYKPKKNHTYVRPFETNENEWKNHFFSQYVENSILKNIINYKEKMTIRIFLYYW
jgi:hypothetical protein